jgi:hypothetical protein
LGGENGRKGDGEMGSGKNLENKESCVVDFDEGEKENIDMTETCRDRSSSKYGGVG